MRHLRIVLCSIVALVVGMACVPTVQAQTFDLQTEVNAKCAGGGGAVQIPLGSFPLTSVCSGLSLIGQGRGQSELAPCPTTIFTTATTGALINIAGMNHLHISDLCLKNSGPGGGTAMQLNWGQFVVAERLYFQGPFSFGIVLNPSTTGSTISNTFRDIHMTGFMSGAIGCLLDSRGLSAKVINNNYFENVDCLGGTNGIGLSAKGGAGTPAINENLFKGGEFVAPGGKAVSILQGATRNLTIQGGDLEGSATGLYMESGQDGFSCLGCNISANTTNTDIALASTRTFFTGNVGGVLQKFGVDPAGNLQANSYCTAPAACDPGNINVPHGSAIEASGTTIGILFNDHWQIVKPFQIVSSTFDLLGTPTDGTIQICTDCGATANCVGTQLLPGTGALAKRINGAWSCK